MKHSFHEFGKMLLNCVGVGVSQTIGLFVVSVTYSQVIAYAVYFLGASFSPNLPWNTCDAWWNTEGNYFLVKYFN